FDLHAFILKRAKPELRTLQVGKNADWIAMLCRQVADPQLQFARQLVACMAHVDTKHIDASLKQLFKHLWRRRRWSYRGDQLHASIAPHSPSASGSARRIVHSFASPVSTSKKPVRL